MRILHVVADGRPGGGTTNVLALAEDQRAAGHDVTLLTDRGSYAVDAARRFAVQVREAAFFTSRFDPRLPEAIDRTVRTVAPDVVHVHGARAGFLYALRARRGTVPSVYTVRGYHFLRKPRGVRHAAALAERLASARTDLTVHVCAYDARLARAWRLTPGGRSVVIHNGIRRSDVPAPGPVDPRRVVTLGRLARQKDPGMVVAVARLLADEGFRFRLIGGGPLEATVRQAIADAGLEGVVDVTGALPRAEALAAMRDAGAFLLPSRWEGFPIAPIEAMEMGIPVVLSNVSGMPEVVGDDAGVLVEAHDPQAYASALRRVAGDDAWRATLVARARERVATHFTRDVVTASYLDAYRRVTGR
ncbi:MAG: glycosyltransferase [Trueperaceae bacterium]|nr:glycosyltransferase [Trueperaceae bacterium]